MPAFMLSLLNHFQEFIFCQNRNSQLSGFTFLGAGILAYNHEAGLLGYRTGCLAAKQFDLFRSLITGEFTQRTGQHKGLTRKPIVRDFSLTFKIYTGIAKLFNQML